jgi:hypothetical protein
VLKIPALEYEEKGKFLRALHVHGEFRHKRFMECKVYLNRNPMIELEIKESLNGKLRVLW